MVDIISRASGPGPQDERLRKILTQNRGTIAKIADHLTQGGYSASQKPKEEPKPEGRIVHVLGGAAAAGPADVRIRVSINGRVVAYDAGSGRQIHHLGDLRRREGREVFVLATAANGFFAPVDPEVAAALAPFDGTALAPEGGEDRLAGDIARALGIA
ncbi:hypothetical protein [Oharaeibacter diazotrophicus]|uniref:Uncharacterized protein n=1 Tax=Oharaeibacter diazotrophicus TaxID=1920512 RepID=A0A4R6RFF1_9HYPH|nr:hypothetical protein [Oharaeibacter diazotrophicus]TDP84952.1 hypothetical protein EDD54_1796 [Oharaeibacter diazotrophicus]BBE73922.1 hypothetical protein OHA_1_03546 [Pleomorphomonas sp. SM30]GLS76393.1 hypothetical protein GCM10007904_17280 [Oharaeibacter diazotrophicus]